MASAPAINDADERKNAGRSTDLMCTFSSGGAQHSGRAGLSCHWNPEKGLPWRPAGKLLFQ